MSAHGPAATLKLLGSDLAIASIPAAAAAARDTLPLTMILMHSEVRECRDLPMCSASAWQVSHAIFSRRQFVQ